MTPVLVYFSDGLLLAWSSTGQCIAIATTWDILMESIKGWMTIRGLTYQIVPPNSRSAAEIRDVLRVKYGFSKPK